MKIAGRVLLSAGMILAILMVAIATLTACKVITPLVVISGSMEPTISTGSLIIAVKNEAASLRVGEIATLRRQDGVLITHRIVSNEPVSDSDGSTRMIRMKGDANGKEDQHSYVQSDALKPYIVIPTAGSIVDGIVRNTNLLMVGAFFGVGLYLLITIVFSNRSKTRLE